MVPGLQSTASIVGVPSLICFMAYGIILDQKLNLSPVLAGGFLTSGPPEKSSKHHFKLAQEVCEIPSISLSHFTDEDVKIQVKRSDS